MRLLRARGFCNPFLGSRRTRARRKIRRSAAQPARCEVFETRTMLTTFIVDQSANPGGDGSAAAPFQTIQQGVDAAASLPGPDTVEIATGNYAENVTIADPDSVHLSTLSGMADVSIDGNGSDVISLTMTADVNLEQLSVSGGDRGIIAVGGTGTLSLVGVDSRQNARGGVVAVNTGDVIIAYSTLVQNVNGTYLQDVGDVTIASTIAADNSFDGIQIARSGNVNVTDVQAYGNIERGIRILENANTVSVSNSTLSDNGLVGLSVGNGNGDLFVTDTVADRNGRQGIDINSVKSATLRGITSSQNGATASNSSTGGAGVRINSRAPDATFSLIDSVVQNNTTQAFGDFVGGGVEVAGHVVAFIEGTLIDGNQAPGGDGGGINFVSTATGSVIRDSVVSNNHAAVGGGISYRWPEAPQMGTLTIERTTIQGNSTNTSGGGIYAQNQNLTIRESSILGNSAGTASFDAGGGLYLRGNATIENSTIHGNTAPDGGGVAIRNNPATIVFNHVTIASNLATDSGGGIDILGTNVITRLANTLIAQNTAGNTAPDIQGNFSDLSFNLIGDATGSNANTSQALIGTAASPVDPLLGPLANNGGSTLTRALLPGSPAIDAVGATNLVLPTDQRGAGRIQYQSDVGAYEVQQVPVLVLDIRSSQLNERGISTTTIGRVNLEGSTLTEDLVVTLSVSDADELAVPMQVTIPAGATTSGFFEVFAVDDLVADGDQLVVVTASASGLESTTDTVLVVDSGPPNTPPEADDQFFAVDEDGTLSGQLVASDVDGDQLTYQLGSGPTNHFAFGFFSSGSFSYTPQPNFHGTDTFTFVAFDGEAHSNLVTVTITVNPLNDAPVAQPESFSTNEDTAVQGDVLTNDSDIDGDTLTALLVNGPANGSLILNSDGTFTYSPAADFHGSDSFTYQADDGAASSNVATVMLTVDPVNDAPVLEDAAFSIAENTPAGTTVGQVTGTDVDGDGLAYSITAGNTDGAFSIASDGSITVANSAALDFETTPSFSLTVEVTDGTLTDTATVTIQLTDVVETIAVEIDVQPGDPANEVSLGRKGKIEVAILSTATFDASQIDIDSLRFGQTGTEDSLRRKGRHQTPDVRFEDIDGDGLLDLIAVFDSALTGLTSDDTEVFLTGTMLEGTPIEGSEAITVSSGGGNGKGNGNGNGKGKNK